MLWSQCNPFRYRGYYYDSDTGLYYLQSRYYDPEVGRFINADDENLITATIDDLCDKNFFSYCDNNPIVRADLGGEIWNYIIGGLVGATCGAISAAISGGNAKAILLNAATGLIGGVVGASTLGLVGQVVASGLLSGGSNLSNQLFVENRKLEDVDFVDVIVDTGIGMVSSVISYATTFKSMKKTDDLINKGKSLIDKGKNLKRKGKNGKNLIKSGKNTIKNAKIQQKRIQTKSSVISSVVSNVCIGVKNFFGNLFR